MVRTDRIAEPVEIREIHGGRFDGDYLVRSTCPGCGEIVMHILDSYDYGSHRLADCTNRCRGGYVVARPIGGLLGLPVKWWDPAPDLFASDGTPGLLASL